MFTLHNGDCLQVMPTIPSGSIDAIITDLPYGTTACKWDTVIEFAPMWKEVKRVLKPNGVFVTTASQPFTSALVMSNPSMFKCEWIWNKTRASNFASVKYHPLRYHENIVLFGSGAVTYNPQMETGERYHTRITKRGVIGGSKTIESLEKLPRDTRYPSSVLVYPNMRQQDSIHPTQKPVALYEYLIKTYTNEGDTVLDMAFGSCTTGEACINTGRNFIGIEKDEKYFQIGKNRLGA